MYLDIYCNKYFISVGVLLKKINFFIKFRALLKESACYSAGFNVGNTVSVYSMMLHFVDFFYQQMS